MSIVSHDAGGAEILSSYVLRNKINCNFVLAGPAINIFNKKLGGVLNISIEQALHKSDAFLCGTGWQTDFEFEAIKIAKFNRIKSIAFLDHWVNFSERFIRNNIEIHPDEIWVGDEYAMKLAKAIFSGLTIKLVKNPYFQDIQECIESQILSRKESHIRETGDIVLFVSEPISDHAVKISGDLNHYGYTEFDALNFFLKHSKLVSNKIDRVVVRPHPAELSDKYSSYIDSENIILGGKVSLIKEILASDIVIGCESMALVVALLAGKKAISAIPPLGHICRLPHRELIHLRDLLPEFL